ncbi:MAG: DUF4412 domain-containing protein [Flavobacteriales bacterium]|nr:DUF4412 domain-containing protein [Flavobacteriales bacterium]
MKYSNLLSLFLLIAFSANVAFAQSGFEGVITYKTTNAAVKESSSVTWYRKGDKNLMEFNSKGGDYHLQYSMLMGVNDETVYMTSDKGSQEVSGIKGEEIFTAANFVRKATTTESGYNCEMLMFKSNGNDLTYWVTSDIGIGYADLPRLFRNNMPSFSGVASGFPIKMELRDSNGNLLRSQEVVSVEQKKIDESKFRKN